MDLGANELDHVLEGHLPADPARDHGRRAARVQPVDRRLRHHQLHVGQDARRSRCSSTPRPAIGIPVAGQRDRHDHLPDRRRPRRALDARQRAGGRCATRPLASAAWRHAEEHAWSTPPEPDLDRHVPCPTTRVVPAGLEPDHEPRRRPRRGLVADHPRRRSATSTTRRGSASPTPATRIRASRRRSRRRPRKLLHGQQNIVYHEPGLRLYERLRHVLPGRAVAGVPVQLAARRRSRPSVKLARVATGRPAIIAFRYGYHGRTAQTMALTTAKDVYRGAFEPLPGSVYHTAYPYCYRAAGGAHDPTPAPATGRPSST